MCLVAEWLQVEIFEEFEVGDRGILVIEVLKLVERFLELVVQWKLKILLFLRVLMGEFSLEL